MRTRLLAVALLLLLPGCVGSDDVVVSASAPLIVQGYSYDGKAVVRAQGSLDLRLDEADDRGTVVARVKDLFHDHEVRWTTFSGRAPFQSGGVATGLDLWGDSGNGSSALPRIPVHVAAFGTARYLVDNQTHRDPTSLDETLPALLFVTEGRYRDPDTYKIEDAQRTGAYDPAAPADAYINRIGAQAVVLLFTDRGELYRHFDYQDVQVRSR